MKPVFDRYPVFEANQVLSNQHLNQVFDYLDEQGRLTRANLVGIGIVCGLELRRPASGTIALLRGCGITSSGYLIVEPDDLELVACRSYTMPLERDYPPLRDPAQANRPQYPLWELFATGEPDTTPLDSPAGFLDDKAVLLFMELKQEGLRNCSPNDCNDRGAQVSATVRRLLIRTSDLAAIIAAANGLDGLSVADLESTLSARLGLPDLRLLRFDVPNTGPATSSQVLAAFHAVFRDGALAARTGSALSAAWTAFRPLLQDEFPADPFAGFSARFGFLDTAPQTVQQVLFLQYYYDFFDDLVRAYDEMRWKGSELLCACCPDEALFPRHLMLGVLLPASVANPGLYRHGFAPACAGDQLVDEFLQLFRRLAGMVDSFTDQPPLPAPSGGQQADAQVRITPSVQGAAPLADMALPYYYRLLAAAPLFRVWSPERARRNRANQNLGYRSDEYTPAAPPFVLEALRHDIAPYNFLRIEGHLGKDVEAVLRTLLALKSRYRLAVDVIALRTGAFDESVPLPAGDAARFEDLEALYDTLREELLRALCEGVRYLYGTAIKVELPGGPARLPLLVSHAPGFQYAPGTLGAWYEKHLAILQAKPYIDPDQDKIDANAVFMVYCFLFAGTTQLPEPFFAHAVSVYYLSKLSESLPASLDALAFADFENKYQDLVALTRYLRDEKSRAVTPDLAQFIPAEELVDYFDQVLYGCSLDAMRALHHEYQRRLRELRKKLFLSSFLQTNPGIQHKAGVPIGGTFIVVYHGEPAPAAGEAAGGRVLALANAVRANPAAMSSLLRRIVANEAVASDPDVRDLLGTLTGEVAAVAGSPTSATGAASDAIIAQAVKSLAKGAVIADFYLPYLYSADRAAVQYVLPLPPLGLSVALGCTNAAGSAEATLTPSGGLAPITYQLDGQPFKPLTGPLLLAAGPHKLSIRDSAGAQSALQELVVPGTLIIGAPGYTEDLETMTWRVAFPVTGGTLPYQADSGNIDFNQFTSDPVPAAEALKVVIADSAGCEVSGEFRHEMAVCKLPCDGFAVRCGYRFWLPEPDPLRPYGQNGASARVSQFRIEIEPGRMIDLTREVTAILRADGNSLDTRFDDVAGGWVKRINELIFTATGNPDSFSLGYERRADGMAILWIEHFECLDFEFRVAMVFARREVTQVLDLMHSPKGSTFNLAEPVTIPPFDCRSIAKCDPERPVTEFCKEVDLQIEIRVGPFSVREIELAAKVSGSSAAVVLVWEVQDCEPPMATREAMTFKVAQPAPLLKQIRLSAFTRDGCMVVAMRQLNIG
jgi:hypothetical protein